MALREHHCLRNRFLVASQPVRDLLLCAKYLFVAARVSVDGQPSLLVGSRSGAERRWIEGARSTEPGSLVRRRYSACPVDSCRNVYSVGQPTMSPCGASAACAAHHFVLGTSQEGPSVASTNKYLAQINKSADGGQSDKEEFGPTVSPQLVQSGKGRKASDPGL